MSPGALRRGDVFEHKFWLDEQHRPALCLVTAVRAGTVYYRTHHGSNPDGSIALGARRCFEVSDAAKYVGPVLGRSS